MAWGAASRGGMGGAPPSRRMPGPLQIHRKPCAWMHVDIRICYVYKKHYVRMWTNRLSSNHIAHLIRVGLSAVVLVPDFRANMTVTNGTWGDGRHDVELSPHANRRAVQNALCPSHERCVACARATVIVQSHGCGIVYRSNLGSTNLQRDEGRDETH